MHKAKKIEIIKNLLFQILCSKLKHNIQCLPMLKTYSFCFSLQVECCFHGDLALRGFIVTIEFRTFGTGWSLLMASPNCQLLLATGFLVKIVVVPFHIENAILEQGLL